MKEWMQNEAVHNSLYNRWKRAYVELKVSDFHISLASKPEVIKTVNNQIVIQEGKTLLIHCKGRGQPQPQIKWFRDNHELNVTREGDKTKSKSRHNIYSKSNDRTSRLRIADVTVADSGNYTCKAENEHGSIQKWVYIAVQSHLETTTQMDDLTSSTTTISDESKCSDKLCQNNGKCINYEKTKYICQCKYGYEGNHCEILSNNLFNNGSENACAGRILDCLQRTDRILTGTGIGLALSAFFLIILLSWYMTRHRRQYFDKENEKKRNNYCVKSVQVGNPYIGHVSSRTVGIDVEYDLCVIDHDYPYSSEKNGPSNASLTRAHCVNNIIARSVTFPRQVKGSSSSELVEPLQHKFSTFQNSSHNTYYPHQNYFSEVSSSGSSPQHFKNEVEGSLCSVAGQNFLYRPLRSVPSGESDLHQTSMGHVTPTEDTFIGSSAANFRDSIKVQKNVSNEPHPSAPASTISKILHYEEFHRINSTNARTCDLATNEILAKNKYLCNCTTESSVWLHRPSTQENTYEDEHLIPLNQPDNDCQDLDFAPCQQRTQHAEIEDGMLSCSNDIPIDTSLPKNSTANSLSLSKNSTTTLTTKNKTSIRFHFGDVSSACENVCRYAAKNSDNSIQHLKTPALTNLPNSILSRTDHIDFYSQQDAEKIPVTCVTTNIGPSSKTNPAGTTLTTTRLQTNYPLNEMTVAFPNPHLAKAQQKLSDSSETTICETSVHSKKHEIFEKDKIFGTSLL